ncbi:MAG: vitamin K epoxide reductase family protein, partial [bacterium]|nr:vitamin K epoxide reductase family protein [bacterium]
LPSLEGLEIFLVLASSGAFLFSAYLTFIQFFNLKQLCTWCLFSAFLSTCIFIFSLFGSLELIFPMLVEYRSIVITLHVLMMALGLGAATLADVFFFRFLRDYKISQEESAVLNTISEFIWLVLAGIVITGLALYMPEMVRFNETPKFLVKAIIVGVILVNGAFLNLVVAPRLVKISFGERHKHEDGELGRIRRIAFALGPISIVSWYSAFLLGMVPGSVPYPFIQILSVYLVLVVIAVAFGQIYDYSLIQRAKKHHT